jgi:Domain of unknown function (DUF4331)
MKKIFNYTSLASLIFLAACQKNVNDDFSNPAKSGGVPPQEEAYIQGDQMARPAINTVFVGSSRKDEFNITTPAAMSAAFKTDFVNKLTSFGYTSNILGLDKNTFASVLVTDVLNASTTGVTSFYDGTNVLTGRTLADDVIDVELTLIFGGATGTSNPGLTSDRVNANDKPFLVSFPYMASPH